MAKKKSNTGIPGLSFSAKRATGITNAKRKVAKKTGIPTTKSGRQRKVGKAATGGGCLLPVFVVTALICAVIVAGCSSTEETSATQPTTVKTTKAVTTTIQPTTVEPTTVVPTTAEPTTEKPTEPPTEKLTEPPTEAPKIEDNASSDGFWAEGNGDYVADGLHVKNYAVLHIEHNGDGGFSVVSYEGDEYDELLVAEVGNYSGDLLIDHSGDFNLEVKCSSGNWSIKSSELSIDDSSSFSGNGDTITGITSYSGGSWKLEHFGEGGFSVVEYGVNEGYMELLVAKVGNYSGIVKVEKAPNIFFEVKADGDWTIEKQ